MGAPQDTPEPFINKQSGNQGFRCVVRQCRIDQKDQKTIDASNARVHLCWINPALPPSSAQAAVEKSGTK
jgi:hypothetical protein